MIYIKQIKTSLVPGKVKAVVECRQDERAAFESIAGTKYFVMRAGELASLRLSKAARYKEGDSISLKKLVLTD